MPRMLFVKERKERRIVVRPSQAKENTQHLVREAQSISSLKGLCQFSFGRDYKIPGIDTEYNCLSGTRQQIIDNSPKKLKENCMEEPKSM